MQVNPEYEDVVGEVRAFLKERIAVCEAAGIHRQRLLADPGFGFGKSQEHNLTLLRRLEAFTALGVPVLAGLSRKSLIGHVLGRPVDERLAGSIALAVLAATRGARILRVHDVAETVDAVRMVEAVLGS
jgi:dihydropteroate synthase